MIYYSYWYIPQHWLSVKLSNWHSEGILPCLTSTHVLTRYDLYWFLWIWTKTLGYSLYNLSCARLCHTLWHYFQILNISHCTYVALIYLCKTYMALFPVLYYVSYKGASVPHYWTWHPQWWFCKWPLIYLFHVLLCNLDTESLQDKIFVMHFGHRYSLSSHIRGESLIP